MLPSPRPSSPASVAASTQSKRRPPAKPWWEYEEQLARLAYDLKAEAASARALHTRDLGILLQQQLALRGRVDELHTAFDHDETAGPGIATRVKAGGPAGDKLASAVAATAQEATELQLTLLERGAASLRGEADAAKAEAEAARADASEKAAEIARLHAQLASMTKRLQKFEQNGPRPPVPPTPPPRGKLAGAAAVGADERAALQAELASGSAENRRLRDRLQEAEGSAMDANRLLAEAEAGRRKLKRRLAETEQMLDVAHDDKETAVSNALATVAQRAHRLAADGDSPIPMSPDPAPGIAPTWAPPPAATAVAAEAELAMKAAVSAEAAEAEAEAHEAAALEEAANALAEVDALKLEVVNLKEQLEEAGRVSQSESAWREEAVATAAAVRTAEREEARSFLRTAEASVLEARGFSAAVSKELETKVGDLHEARAELKAAKKAMARAKLEAEGRIAQMEALHKQALAEATEAASSANSANEGRLTKLAASQLRSLQEADEAASGLRGQVTAAKSAMFAAQAGAVHERTSTEVVAREVTYLEAQVENMAAVIDADVAGAKRTAAIEKQAAAAAEGRAAAAELQAVALRVKLGNADERMEAAGRAAEAAAAAAREAHGSAINEMREVGARDRERHAELVESLRMELAQTRDAHTAAMARAEDVRIRLVREEGERGALALKEAAEAEGTLRRRVAELEASQAALNAENARVLGRAAASEDALAAERAASNIMSHELRDVQQALATEEGMRRGHEEAAARASSDAAESAGAAAEARARAEALHGEVDSLHTKLEKSMAAQQQEGVNQVIQLQGAVASALATAQAREDAAARAAEQRLQRIQSATELDRATQETLLQEASAARTKSEAALEATRRDAAAENRRLREAAARAEAQEESLAARLLAAETAHEDMRRMYERRLSESADMLRASRHDGAMSVDDERGRYEAQIASLRSDLERATAAHRRHANALMAGQPGAAPISPASSPQAGATPSVYPSPGPPASPGQMVAAFHAGGAYHETGGERGGFESRIRIMELEAEIVEATRARVNAEASEREAAAERDMQVAAAEAAALEEARAYVMSEAEAFDAKLAAAQSAHDQLRKERAAEVAEANGVAEAAVAALAAERSRGAAERRLLTSELLEREEVAHGLHEASAHAAVEARLASHTHAGQLTYLTEHSAALVLEMDSLVQVVAAEATSHSVCEAILSTELREAEGAAELSGLRKWWREYDLPDMGGSAGPLTHEAARREHLSALRGLLGGRPEGETATSAILSAEILKLEERCVALEAQLKADGGGAHGGLEGSPSRMSGDFGLVSPPTTPFGENEVDISRVREADAKLLTLQAGPASDFKQKGRRKHTRGEHSHTAASSVPTTQPAVPAAPTAPAADVASLEALLEDATRQLTQQRKPSLQLSEPPEPAPPSPPPRKGRPPTPVMPVAPSADPAALNALVQAADAHKAEKAALQTEVQGLQAEVADLRAEKERLPSERGDEGALASEVAELNRQCDDLEEECEVLSVQLKAANELKSKLGAQLSEAREHGQSVATQLAAANQKVSSLEEGHASLSAQLQMAIEQADHLRGELATRSDELAALRARGADSKGGSPAGYVSEEVWSAEVAATNGVRVELEAALAAAATARTQAAAAQVEAEAAQVDLEAVLSQAQAAQVAAAAARADATAAQKEAAVAQGEAVASKAEADAARLEAAKTQAEADGRAKAHAELASKIENQLFDQMRRTESATRALRAAEEIHRQLTAAIDGAASPLTVVLIPDE